MKKLFKKISAFALAAILMIPATAMPAKAAEEAETKNIQILCTSDLHGKFVPFKYAIYEEDYSGSLAQVATVVKERRDDNTILIDVGDTIQDNSSDIFFEDDNHPMMVGMNYLNYDYWVFGNHEFNYGVDVLKKVRDQFEGTPLCANVYDTDQETRLGTAWDIKVLDGVRVAVIGVVTPNITQWDRENLTDYKVNGPIEEIQAALNEMDGQYDVLVLAVHEDTENEFDYYGSGADDLAAEFPQADVILASHGHTLVTKKVNDDHTLITENLSGGQSIMDIDITVQANGEGGYDVVTSEAEAIKTKGIEADADFCEALEPYNQKAKEDAQAFVGELVGGDLVGETEIPGITQSQIEPSAMMDLINTVQMYYSDADVSAAAVFSANANIKEGAIRKCDTALIYKFDNTLYRVKFTGKQLKQYMEWSVNYYQQYQEGDLTIAFNTDMPSYLYDIFAGVKYEINISKPAGERIENLTRMDGTPIEDDDELIVALNNYRATSNVTNPGERISNVFKTDDLVPEIIEKDCAGGVAIRDLITKYIQEVKGGTITPECADNWKITGTDWNEEDHARVAALAKAGEITVTSQKAFTTEDLAAYDKAAEEAAAAAAKLEAVKNAVVEATVTPAITTAKVALTEVAEADGYTVLYSTDDTFAKFEGVNSTAAAVKLTGLKAGTTYYVKALAYTYDEDGNKVYSKSNVQAAAVTTKMHTPGKVTIKSLESKSKGKMTVTFKAAKNAQKYLIQYSTDKNFAKKVKTISTTETTATIKKLTSKKTYYVKVTAVAADDTGKEYTGKDSKVKSVVVK